MKNLIIFISGCICGSVGTLLYLRKDIQNRMEAMENSSESTENKDEELPFTVGEGGEVDEVRSDGIAINDDTRVREVPNKVNTNKVRYDDLVRKTMSSEDINAEEDPNDDGDDPQNEAFYEELKSRPQFEPIYDMSDFNDPNFSTETYIFYRGDNVFCTDNGTIVERPALLVGTEWPNWIGKVKPNTALVRDNKRIKSIDIFVEDGLYSDEYGDYIEED